MFYDLMKDFWQQLLHLDSFTSDYLATVTSIIVIFCLLMLFLGLFCRVNFVSSLIIVLITISIFFTTTFYFEKKTESEITISQTVTQSETITQGGEGV